MKRVLAAVAALGLFALAGASAVDAAPQGNGGGFGNGSGSGPGAANHLGGGRGWARGSGRGPRYYRGSDVIVQGSSGIDANTLLLLGLSGGLTGGGTGLASVLPLLLAQPQQTTVIERRRR